MKVVKSQFQNVATIAPVRGGYHVTFQNYRATVPDDVAFALVGMNSTFFTVERELTPAKAGRILVIRDMGLGDVLLTTPLVRELASCGAQVDFATLRRYMPILENNPHVSNILDMDMGTVNPTGYDGVIDLRMFVENAENAGEHANRAAAFGRAADIPLPNDPTDKRLHLDYFVKDAEQDWAKRTLSAHPVSSRGKWIGQVWRTSTRNRSWSAVRSQAALASLVKAGFNVAVFDHETQPLGPFSEFIYDGTGKHSIRETAALINEMSAIVSPDTGLFHMASALSKPVVTYFGPFPVVERATHASVVDLAVHTPCHPCRHYFCMNKCDDDTPKCLDVPTERLVHAVLQAV